MSTRGPDFWPLIPVSGDLIAMLRLEGHFENAPLNLDPLHVLNVLLTMEHGIPMRSGRCGSGNQRREKWIVLQPDQAPPFIYVRVPTGGQGLLTKGCSLQLSKKLQRMDNEIIKNLLNDPERVPLADWPRQCEFVPSATGVTGLRLGRGLEPVDYKVVAILSGDGMHFWTHVRHPRSWAGWMLIDDMEGHNRTPAWSVGVQAGDDTLPTKGPGGITFDLRTVMVYVYYRI